MSSVNPILLRWSWECVLCLIITIKSEVWIINHCLGLGHETMVCAVCLTLFLCIQIQRHSKFGKIVKGPNLLVPLSVSIFACSHCITHYTAEPATIAAGPPIKGEPWEACTTSKYADLTGWKVASGGPISSVHWSTRVVLWAIRSVVWCVGPTTNQSYVSK